MKIEFLKAYEDHTWDTEVIDVPDAVTTEQVAFDTIKNEPVMLPISSTDSKWDSAIIAWCHDELLSQAQYRKVVYWGIYNSEPEQEEADEPA